MIIDATFSVHTAYTRTWVFTFVIYASSIFRAIGIEYAFWSTFYVWITIVINKARTRSDTMSFFANSICSTRWSRTRAFILWFDSYKIWYIVNYTLALYIIMSYNYLIRVVLPATSSASNFFYFSHFHLVFIFILPNFLVPTVKKHYNV